MSLSSVSPLSSPSPGPGVLSERPKDEQQQQQSDSKFPQPQIFLKTYGTTCVALIGVDFLPAAESTHVAVEPTWEDSISEALETEVLETRRMVSTLQVLNILYSYQKYFFLQDLLIHVKLNTQS